MPYNVINPGPYNAMNAGGYSSVQPAVAGGSGDYRQTPMMAAQDAYAHNQQQYQQILNGYQQQQQQAAAQQAQRQAGYNQLTQQVVGELRGSQAAGALDLQNQYQHNLAGTQQNLMSRGLGNTTAVEGARNAVQQQYNQAMIGLNSQYAGQIAGAMGQYGSQALGYGAQSDQALQGLQSNQLGYMGQSQGQGYQLYGQMLQGAQGFGYQKELGMQNYGYQAALNQQNFNNQQAAARQQQNYQQQAADHDFMLQNQYDTSGGGYAGD